MERTIKSELSACTLDSIASEFTCEDRRSLYDRVIDYLARRALKASLRIDRYLAPL